MPIQNPSNTGLFDAIGRAMDWSSKLYRENVPSSVRKNLGDIFDAPVPGNPFAAGKGILQAGDAVSEAVTALPLIARALRSGKATKNSLKLAQKLKQMFGVGLDPVPVNRFQQEAVDYPVSQGGRGGTFFSYGSDYPGYVKSTAGASEGGQYGVNMNLELKNPLFLKRGNDFIGPEIVHTLAPKKTRNMVAENWEGHKQVIDPRSESKKLLEAVRNLSLGWSSSQQEQDAARGLLQKYLHPRQIDTSLQSRSRKNALEEALASSLLNKHGYDSAVSLRPEVVQEYTDRSLWAHRLSENLENLNSSQNLPHIRTYRDDYPDDLVKLIDKTIDLRRRGISLDPSQKRILKKVLDRGIEPTEDILNKVYEYNDGDMNNPVYRMVIGLADKGVYHNLLKIGEERTKKTTWKPTQIFLTDPERNKAWQKRFAEEMKRKNPPAFPGPGEEDFLGKLLEDLDKYGIGFFEPEK